MARETQIHGEERGMERAIEHLTRTTTSVGGSIVLNGARLDDTVTRVVGGGSFEDYIHGLDSNQAVRSYLEKEGWPAGISLLDKGIRYTADGPNHVFVETENRDGRTVLVRIPIDSAGGELMTEQQKQSSTAGD